MGDWLKMYYYGRIKPSKAKQLFATCNFLYSLLLFATWHLCNHPFNEGNDYYMTKQYDAAEAASADAKKWSIIGIVVGLVFQIIYLALFGGLGYLSTLSH